METPTSLVIGQLADYLRALTSRLDPGAGWYGEFLRRDPEGMRACLDGVAVPPWDVLDSLLADLAGAAGAEPAAHEAVYAARLRAAAAAALDGTPDGARELPALLAAAAGQRAASEAAVRTLTARLGAVADPGEAAALSRELSWTRDDAARAAARHADLTARLHALRTAPRPAPADPAPTGPAVGPLPSVPRQREAPPAPLPPPAPPAPPASPAWPGPSADPGPQGHAGPVAPPVPPADPGAPAPGGPGSAPAQPPVARAEGRWLRGGGRRAGGARYAGATAGPDPVSVLPPGTETEPAASAPRGARFGARPVTAPGTPDRPKPAPGAPEPAPRTPAPEVAAFVARLLDLRARGRGGEAHALLCEAAAWPARLLPALAAGLAGAGLAADWATLLWEAASLPPGRLAEAAAALADAGRDTDCGRLLRQGVARPAAEVADAALALGAAGREREAHALLGAFVGLRTAEEAAALARRDPHWFAPRLLRAARSQPGTRHRDLSHALRVAGIPEA
ncbi:hypothetical protein ABZZ17_16005 [Streptomyces sp. NPDC006512]|uniref:hypothetical protein n=1 Tax=Streptomyces sp. NPDC006512 TaxID=3154307 RepID=UPI0033A5B37B